jgi:hypothetical protein
VPHREHRAGARVAFIAAAGLLALAGSNRRLPAAPLDPASVSLEQLAAIRGAMWTARHAMRTGPRPAQPSNILALPAIAAEPPDVRAAAWRAYTSRGYTHGVIGAWQPDGFSPYHDVYPQQRLSFDQYLDVLQEFWNNGVMPVVFIKPDGWSCGQLDSLTQYYSQPRAQRLVRIQVAGGWEPGKDTANAEWVCWLQWGRRVLPNALSLVHMEADVDVPGNKQDQDSIGIAGSWNRVAPLVHGYLVQNAGYVYGGNEQPTREFTRNFTDQFRLNPKPGRGSLMDRFTWGYAGWPTSSAWGSGQRMRVYAAEYAAFANFWWDWDERFARQLGDAAMAAGADGYLDGGTTTVPLRRSPPR